MLFKEAADQITKNPISLQLQWMETIKDISKSTMSTMILPNTCIGTWADIMKLADGSPGTYDLKPNSSRQDIDDQNSNTGWEMEEEGVARNVP